MKKTILVLGATSMIAREMAAAWAQRGYSLFLASRDVLELERMVADFSIRYEVPVKYSFFDVCDFASHKSFCEKVEKEAGDVHGVFLACGLLGEQALSISNFSEAQAVIDSNYTGPCSILTHCVSLLKDHQECFIAAITSVAGDRGRQSNYVYGSAKAGLTVFLEGLRNRLYSRGIRVLTIKPGFVDTAMTYGRPGMFLVATPKEVAQSIIKAIDKGKNTIYVPWFWRPIMSLIRSIPESLFKRLKL